MKTAVILHGIDGRPDSNWFRWLESQFEAAGYEVWLPQLPGAHLPNRLTWNDFVLTQGPELTDAIVVGHSAGAVEILNLLSDARTPKIKLGVLVSAWPGGSPSDPDGDFDAGQFDYLFLESGFDFKAIEQKAGALAFLHGSDDPYCPLPATQELAQRLDAPIKVIQGGQHLGDKFSEFPQLWRIIEPHL